MKKAFASKKTIIWGGVGVFFVSVVGVSLVLFFVYGGEDREGELSQGENAQLAEVVSEETVTENVSAEAINGDVSSLTQIPTQEPVLVEEAEVAPAVVPVVAPVEKPAIAKTDKRIKCKMKVKEIKQDKKKKDEDLQADVSWECSDSQGWSCDIKREGDKKGKETQKNVALPKGSKKMTIKKGDWESRTTVRTVPGSEYICSGVSSGMYRSGCISAPSRTVVDTSHSYNRAVNIYKMECQSVDGKIMRFEEKEVK